MEFFVKIYEFPSLKKCRVFHIENFLLRYTQNYARNIDRDFLLRYALLRLANTGTNIRDI